MSTGLATFDKTLQTTHLWLNELSKSLNMKDKHKSFQVLRTTLHALRDCLSVEQASKFSSQLPILLVGFFYEDWQPASMPHIERSKKAFLAHIDAQFDAQAIDINTEKAVRAVFQLIAHKVSSGEIEAVKHMLPKQIRALWIEAMPV